MSDKIIQSYVWHKEQCFFVSTINRESSAALLYGMIYAETMIWEYSFAKKERGKLIGQSEDVRDGIYTHIEVCKQLKEKGHLDEGV